MPATHLSFFPANPHKFWRLSSSTSSLWGVQRVLSEEKYKILNLLIGRIEILLDLWWGCNLINLVQAKNTLNPRCNEDTWPATVAQQREDVSTTCLLCLPWSCSVWTIQHSYTTSHQPRKTPTFKNTNLQNPVWGFCTTVKKSRVKALVEEGPATLYGQLLSQVCDFQGSHHRGRMLSIWMWLAQRRSWILKLFFKFSIKLISSVSGYQLES